MELDASWIGRVVVWPGVWEMGKRRKKEEGVVPQSRKSNRIEIPLGFSRPTLTIEGSQFWPISHSYLELQRGNRPKI